MKSKKSDAKLGLAENGMPRFELPITSGKHKTYKITVQQLDEGWVEIDFPEIPWNIQALVVPGVRKPELLGLKLVGYKHKGDPTSFITSESLRILPISHIKKICMDFRNLDFEQTLKDVITHVDREPGKAWPDEHYEMVAETFNRAEKAGAQGIKLIQETWHVSRQMASKYVNEARRRGLVPQLQTASAKPTTKVNKKRTTK